MPSLGFALAYGVIVEAAALVELGATSPEVHAWR